MKKLALILSLISVLVCMSTMIGAAPSMSSFAYNKLHQLQVLMETESWQEASDVLAILEAEIKNKYVQSLVAQSQGQIAIHREDLALALDRFNKALTLGGLDELANKQLLHSVAQLHCAVEEWLACRDKMQKWIVVAADKVQASDYLIVAQAYASTEHWEEVVTPIRLALHLNQKAPKSWHQMLVIALTNIKQWQDGVNAQQNLLAHYPEESEEWRKLVSLHLRQEDSNAALNSMRLPYEKGLLTKADDVRQMALLLYQAGLPYQAGATFSEGLEKAWIEPSEKDLELLARLWIEAKSIDQAINVYKKLIDVAPKRKWYKQLASLYFQEKNWSTVISMINEATQHGLGLDNQDLSELELMRGMALINMNEFDEAKGIFESLTNRDSMKTRAENWLNYIAQIENA